MIEAKGDIWKYAAEEAATGRVAVCVTTNGETNRRGQAVMGRGVALQARNRFLGIEDRIGRFITRHGNHVQRFAVDAPYDLLTFPVKHGWREPADPVLIALSAGELEALVDREDYDVVLLPRPGCGNGHLDWDDVKPLLTFLDDRFWAVDR